jgi:hypothetical protein
MPSPGNYPSFPSANAFVEARPIPSGTHWTRSADSPGNTLDAPGLVAQIGFAEWTSNARLRKPHLIGLRDDNDSSEVVRVPTNGSR